jgi:hypothetical protein
LSCYLRHLKNVLDLAGVAPTNKEERKAVDLAFRELTGVGDMPCNLVWKTVKERIKEPAGVERLAADLKKKMKG